MKPIKKEMTEAVTRDGRKVTQLTWFDCNGNWCVGGVVNNLLKTWSKEGSYSICGDSHLDIFAIPEYEYKIIYKEKEVYNMTSLYYKNKDDFF